MNVDRGLRVAELRLEDLGGELEELRLLLLVVGVVGACAQHLGELRPGAERVVAALERLERLRVRGLLRDDALEDLGGALSLQELRLVELGELEQRVDALGRP